MAKFMNKKNWKKKFIKYVIGIQSKMNWVYVGWKNDDK